MTFTLKSSCHFRLIRTGGATVLATQIICFKNLSASLANTLGPTCERAVRILPTAMDQLPARYAPLSSHFAFLPRCAFRKSRISKNLSTEGLALSAGLWLSQSFTV